MEMSEIHLINLSHHSSEHQCIESDILSRITLKWLAETEETLKNSQSGVSSVQTRTKTDF